MPDELLLLLKLSTTSKSQPCITRKAPGGTGPTETRNSDTCTEAPVDLEAVATDSSGGIRPSDIAVPCICGKYRFAA